MVKEVNIIVYGDPVPKARPRVVNGHAYTPQKTSIHEQKIGLVYKSKYHGDMFEAGKPLAVEADFYMKIPRNQLLVGAIIIVRSFRKDVMI